MILNLAIGGQWGALQGIDPNIFPLKLIVDYVRVYTLQTHEGPYSLTIEPSTGGTVEAFPQQESYAAGTPVQLTASANEGYYFGGFLYMGNTNPLTFEMVEDRTVIPLFYKNGELIKNGTFDRGITGWNNLYIYDPVNQAAATEWQDGVYVFRVINPAAEWWHMGDQWLGIPAISGKTYQVSFDAWADNPGQLGLSFSRNYGNYAAYYENPSVAITQTKTRYTWQFTFNSTSDNNCRIYFGMGRFTGKVYLDNISMTELVATPVNDIVKPGLPAVTVGTEPMTGRMRVEILLMQPEHVNLTLYNLQGIEMETLYNGYMQAGTNVIHTVPDPTRMPAGIYFLRLKSSTGGTSIKFSLP